MATEKWIELRTAFNTACVFPQALGILVCVVLSKGPEQSCEGTPVRAAAGQQDRLPGTHIQTCTKDQIFIAGSCDDGEVCSRLCSRYPEHQKSCARD